MKNDWDGTCGVFIPEGVVVGKLAEPMGRESDRTGWVESQQVVEGGGMYKCECGCEWECEWDHCCVLSGCLLFLSLCSDATRKKYVICFVLGNSPASWF